MNEETIRADFEQFMSDDGKWPQAIERCGAGNYILSQSASSWRVWRNAYHQCLQSPEIQALREDTERLDWLADPNNSIGNVQLPTECVTENLHSLRAAIDAAMEQQT